MGAFKTEIGGNRGLCIRSILLNRRCLVCAFSNIAKKSLGERLRLKPPFSHRWFGEAVTKQRSGLAPHGVMWAQLRLFLNIEAQTIGLAARLGSDIPLEAVSFARASSRTAKRAGAQTAPKLPVKLSTAIC
jgi:hypothetical protein